MDWINVKEKLPKNEEVVLVTCNRNGYKFITIAIHEDGTMLEEDSNFVWYDINKHDRYNEELDDYYVPEGWWENHEFDSDEYNNMIDCEVTHWMPLPELPITIKKE